jgi:DNA-binding CsgD family transcriptional regulator
MEDESALRELAIAEAQAWGLTDRETEVWILRRCQFTRLEMANRLGIQYATVVKHIKNIYVKKLTTVDDQS